MRSPRKRSTASTCVIEALKLNGIDTIFGLPGIPITDLTRMLAGRRACA